VSKETYTIEAALTNALLAYQSTRHQVDVLAGIKSLTENLINRLGPSGIAVEMVDALRMAHACVEDAIETNGPYLKDLEELQHALEKANLKTSS
jgi:hypothetical protein